MSNNKKIKDFSNKPVPDVTDAFLLEAADGTYYYVTQLQLANVSLSGLTTNKVLKAGSATTAVDSNITDDGTSITISSPNNQNLVVVEDNNLYIQYLGTTNAGGLTYLNTYVDLQHDARVNLNAPSVTKNGVEVATVNDIPTVDTTIIDGSTNAVSGNAVFDGLATKVGIESMIINPGGTLNPADGTTYYFGSFISTAPTTLAAARRVYLGKDCSIIGATFTLLVSSTPGTSEDINVYIRVNNTTDYSIGTIKTNSSTQQILINTSMSITLISTDYFEIKMVMPTFVTNPVSVSLSSVVNIR